MMPDLDPALPTKLPRRFRIVVALDLTDYAEVVLEHALDQAARHDAPDVHFITVVEDPSADVEDVKRRLANLVLPALDGFESGEWCARLDVRAGRPYEEIAGFAAEIRAHLIVIGRFGLHHSGKRLGSVASRVIDAATCPTLVVTMVDETPDATVQCPDCVEVRAESDGERWFCAAHMAPDRVSLATMRVPGSIWTGGGLMW